MRMVRLINHRPRLALANALAALSTNQPILANINRLIRLNTLNEMPLDFTAMHQYMCRLASAAGEYNGMPVEKRTKWTEYTPDWRFEPVTQVSYEPDCAKSYDFLH